MRRRWNHRDGLGRRPLRGDRLWSTGDRRGTGHRKREPRMRSLITFGALLAALVVGGVVLRRSIRQGRVEDAISTGNQSGWRPKAAAAYLDERELWWQSWPLARMDHGTQCVSCHTVVPYALVRPALRHRLGENGPSAPETAMLASVRRRVSGWPEMAPFYSDEAYGKGMSARSRATEAVLNAVILAAHDAGEGHLDPVTVTAFNNAWELQEKAGDLAGAWKWQDFHLAPWESEESGYQGAALMAVALEVAPDRYAAGTEAREHRDLLEDYLRRHYAAQPLMSRLYVLWASSRLPGLLTVAERTELLHEIGGLQLPDGGWALPSLDQQPGLKHYVLDHWRQMSGTAPADGCATGLVVLALEEAGVSSRDPVLNRGLQWLLRHQEGDGSWRAASLNRPLDPSSDIGRFMNDAATGYATLALEEARAKMTASDRSL